MAKAAKLKVLYGEGDAEVLATQGASMEKAGHSVQQALGRKAVQEALSKGSFDLVILGPTLSRNDRHHLPYMVKKASAETSVLVMHARWEPASLCGRLHRYRGKPGNRAR